MRTFVIGDVHGMLPELQSLVNKLDPQSGDRFFFLGDLVDKGPDSLGVVRFVRDLMDRFPGSQVVCGNHEESVLRLWQKREKTGTWDGLRKVEREPWIKDVDPDTLEWLRSLPLVVRPMDGVLLVHGGLFPSFFDKHGPIGDVPSSWHKGGGKRMDRMRRFLRIRHVWKPGTVNEKGKDVGGQMVSLGDEGEQTQHWGDWWDGREGFVFFGHDPQRSGSPILHRHCMGLDTGCVFGGNLTGVILDREPIDWDSGRTNFQVSTPGGPLRIQPVSVPGRPIKEWREDGED